MLMALKWDHCTVPFNFRVNHPSRFLRNMQAIRQGGTRRVIADLAAISGVGWLGLKTAHAVLGFRASHGRAEATVVQDFGDWADEIWRKCSPKIAMCAVRNSRSLRAIYPASCPNYTRLKITAGGRTAGWGVLADIRTKDDPQYGSLRVGTIVDGLSAPEDAALVIAAATQVAEERGVDVITSNQSHSAWTQGLKRCGFFQGPSNFILAASKQFSGLIAPFQESFPRSH